ncbi:MAG: flavodoxin family protein [Planctomycetaceae bacterium]|jgi:multimeric flavodoxin WrbA|nr:flavodoxin family protein [Planctomycetaceae bacterium]
MPTIIAFSGSPHENGCTSTLIKEILRGAETQGFQSTFYSLNDTGVRPCQGCHYCRTHNGCAVNDALQPAYADIDTADVIIFGSPIYFHQITGQAKIWIDRMFPMMEFKDGSFVPRHPGKKAVTVFSQGYHKADEYRGVIDMTNRIIQTFGWTVVETLLCYNTSAQDFVMSPVLMQKALDIGKALGKT